MAETYSLIKANPLLPAQDYNALRKEGFKLVEKLGSDTWTEYNNSDPGITMLEAVCYAITDLGYRTGFDIKDILAPKEVTADTWKNIFYTAKQIYHNSPLTINDYRKLMIDVKGVRNAWLEPSKDYEVPVWVDYNAYEKRKDLDCGCDDTELQTCYGKLSLNPVTKEAVDKKTKARLDDIKKLVDANTARLADLNTKMAVLATQIGTEKDPLTKINLQNQLEAFQVQNEAIVKENADLKNENDILKASKFIPSKILELEGLYNVMVEYEEDVLEEEHREEVRQLVIDRLLCHRNLCEDFLSVNAVEYLDFGIGASIVLEEYADPDAVLAAVFFVIYKYFTPSVPFHTFEKLIEQGLQADQVFEGPALKHGFILDDELERTDLFRDIRLSDIINELSDIKGIKAITYLHLPFNGFEEDESGKDYFNSWLNMLREEKKIARIQPSLSSAIMCKEHDLVTYNAGRETDRRPARMLKMFRDLKQQERKYKLEGQKRDLDMPVGEYMELQDYYPITYSLPMCYGVSERAGLPRDADDKRQAQALQLKGYLLFFEQIMAGYLVQLDHLRDLYSFDDKQKKTYFTRALKEISELKTKLLIDHQKRGNDYDQVLEDFTHVLQAITETPAVFLQRRNQFLDHMLGRFSESISEYESLSRWLTPVDVEERLVEDKTAILKDGEYYRISTNRGQGYNYGDPRVWDTNNVSGAEKRISRLLGFHNYERRSLAPEFISSEPVMVPDDKTKTLAQKKNVKKQPLNVIKLADPADKEKIILTSVEVIDGCCTESLMDQILEHADDRRYFKFHEELKQRSRKSAGTLGVFWFELYDDTDPEKAVLLATSEKFDRQEQRDHAFKALQEIMTTINGNEGFHLAEHLLLRPKFDEVLNEIGEQLPVVFPDICLDACDFGKGLDQGTEVPVYQKKIHRIPADKCYDKLPWVLEYFRLNLKTKKYDQSILFQEAFTDGKDPLPLKFRTYDALAKRVRQLYEFGSERTNYAIVSNAEEQPEKIKYSFIIYGDKRSVLAQSPFVFNKQTRIQHEEKTAVPEDIEVVIADLMRFFEFELDLYCDADACDNNEDPFSFRTTLVLPCWPKRFRNATFRNLVQKTIETETPAHVHTRVVWIGIQQMKRFEEVYFNWLREMAQTEMPGFEFVNPFIETINKLKPCGCCDDDCAQ